MSTDMPQWQRTHGEPESEQTSQQPQLVSIHQQRDDERPGAHDGVRGPGEGGYSPLTDPGRRAERPHTSLVRRIVLLSSAILLVLAVCGATAAALVTIQDRNATIADYQKLNGQLSSVNKQMQEKNASLASQLKDTSTQRDELAKQRDALTQQRDGLQKDKDALAQQRDSLSTERDGLKSQVADLTKKNTDLEASVDDQGRQLSQAQQEASRQQGRADNAEAVGGVLAQVVQLDNQIQGKMSDFIKAGAAMDDAILKRNSTAYNIAYGQLTTLNDQIEQLFAQRNALLDQLK